MSNRQIAYDSIEEIYDLYVTADYDVQRNRLAPSRSRMQTYRLLVCRSIPQ